jgi:hypothetical protein
MSEHSHACPIYPDERVEVAEAEEVIEAAAVVIQAAEKVLPHLGIFRTVSSGRSPGSSLTVPPAMSKGPS